MICFMSSRFYWSFFSLEIFSGTDIKTIVAVISTEEPIDDVESYEQDHGGPEAGKVDLGEQDPHGVLGDADHVVLHGPLAQAEKGDLVSGIRTC